MGKLNIFYLEWKSFCNEDMFEVFWELGHHVVKIPFENTKMDAQEIQRRIEKRSKEQECDFVFSFNYFPEVSICCERMGIRYVSWVYDNPHINVYSYTVLNACNRIFLFDRTMYEELHQAGIGTVYYLSLGINEKRLEKLQNTKEKRKKYQCDISFVGSMYSEKKHRLYEKFEGINDYTKGYLEGLMKAQLRVYGYNFLADMLTPEIIAEMEHIYPSDPNASTVLPPERIYADYVLARQVTAWERRDILKILGENGYHIDLYTHDENQNIKGVHNRGIADYYDEMPYIFLNSKINLNITLKSIQTGIPLRALDIMGAGGFLLTNYQEELFENFVEGEDFVSYSDYEDLLEKTAYYLQHEEERKRIARNGCKKVRTCHTLRHKVEQMLKKDGIIL